MGDINIDIADIAAINEFHSSELGFQFKLKDRRWDGFVYFNEGSGIFHDGNGSDFEIKKSSLILLKAGDSYSFSINPGYRYIASAYKITNAEKSLGDLPRIIQCAEAEGLIIEEIYKSWQQRKKCSFLNCKIQILTLYLELFKRCSEDSCGDPAVNRALDFIQCNFKRNFTGAEIASFCGMSESHLRAKFRKNMGMSIIKYREQMRTTEAKKMISSLMFTPKEIAYELGYLDVYHFTKAFKAVVGITPGKYLKLEKLR